MEKLFYKRWYSCKRFYTFRRFIRYTCKMLVISQKKLNKGNLILNCGYGEGYSVYDIVSIVKKDIN